MNKISPNGACSDCWKNIYQGESCAKCGRSNLLEKELKALEFIRRNKGWNTFASDKETIAVIRELAQRDLIEVNEFSQFRAKDPPSHNSI